MIKITKQGIIPKGTHPIYNLTCTLCCTEFECDFKDFTVEQRIGGHAYINCPTCGRLIIKKPIELKNFRIK